MSKRDSRKDISFSRWRDLLLNIRKELADNSGEEEGEEMFHAHDSIDVPAHVLSEDSSADEYMNELGIRRSRLAQDLTNKLLTKTLSNVSAISSSNGKSPKVLDEPLNLSFVPLAQAHWILLGRSKDQAGMCRAMFIYVIINYPHTRPMWQFVRDVNFGNEDWIEKLQKDTRFRHHCSSVQSAVKIVMDNISDFHQMTKLLRDIGSHHFFYDAYEPHLELMHEGFLHALTSTIEDPPLDSDLKEGWNQIWEVLKVHIGQGIANQRQNYLTECVTKAEITSVKAMWEKIKENGLKEAGETVTKEAIYTYHSLLKLHDIPYPINLPKESLAFKMFSQEVIHALDLTIESYTPERGFQDLPQKLKGFVMDCLMIEVCPTLIRKAFMDGLLKLLRKELGEDSMTEINTHAWSKIYRILEQAIIWNIVNY